MSARAEARLGASKDCTEPIFLTFGGLLAHSYLRPKASFRFSFVIDSAIAFDGHSANS